MTALSLLKKLCIEIREIDIGQTVDVVHGSLDPVSFLRLYIAPNKPLLIKGALHAGSACPALQAWTPDYLSRRAGDAQVSVDYTPNGLGDAVTSLTSGRQCFCIPYKQSMSFRAFIETFFATRDASTSSSSSSSRGGWIPYLQQQNSNLTDELPILLPDVAGVFGFADAAFGGPAEATNLWVGDSRSITSFHKDHYENCYAVIRGSKTFHLLPPSDAFRLGLRLHPSAQFQPDEGGQLVPVLQEPPSTVMWSDVQPNEPPGAEAAAAARAAHPLFWAEDLPRPLVVEVEAGDVLYLPAMWWHYVQQHEDEHGWCVAVNSWYEMHFGQSWAYFQMAQSLGVQAGLIPAMPDAEEEEEQGEGGEGGDPL